MEAMAMDDNKVVQAAKIIDGCTSIEDLRAFQDYISSRIRSLESQVGIVFKVGDRVAFTGRRGVKLTGTVTGHSTKGKRPWVHVETEFAGKWNVMPSQLTKLSK
jgi:hypothetical protein